MSRTTASELARLKCQWPAWRIERQGDLFVATEREGQRVLRAGSPAALETRLGDS